MDFAFTPEQEAARQEYEAFFAAEEKNAPEGWSGIFDMHTTDDCWAYHCSVSRKLGERGWLSLGWPKKYGGRELSPIDQLIFAEVRAYHAVPGVDQGPYFVAPNILECGSDEIKEKWLPLIASGTTTWCQGWSEPNAGSDLASLITSAVEDGDDYVINGRKIWTTGAHRASHIFILARTDPNAPKHLGMTYFLTEMSQPGISVTPLLYMDKTHHYNEVTFDNLRVPKANIVGGVNNGWRASMGIAGSERSFISEISNCRHDLETLVELCKEPGPNGKRLADDPVVRNRIAQATIELEITRQYSYYVAWLQTAKRPIESEVSASKYYIADMAVRFYNMALEILGLFGTLKHGSKWTKLQGKCQHNCQANLGLTFAGGTEEILKNVIAQRGLKLPKS
ncbi:MAG: acyl-CoA dehydrogenase family protein [Dehalococcoidia bacterium]|nr:acyl-CoA dehydrogenase family protein [Dehalococcoidia bacterium]